MSAVGTALYRLEYGTFLNVPPQYAPYTTVKVHDYRLDDLDDYISSRKRRSTSDCGVPS